ncbi:HXXEE domain-containing protein [Pyrococcus kukulkanii]|uniref:HXXEE domain-containing protein n=1 Tax=Pyrococcus kukulkanii TaxID=1609559 RepID=A0ABV4T553_9EURY
MEPTKKCSIISWLEEYWPVSTPFLAVYVTVLLVLFVLKENFALFLIWLQTPVYWVHQFEEYVYPGGFVEFFNRKVLGSKREDWPLTKTHALWINVPIIFVAFPLSAILAGLVDVSIGVWTAYFSILNALSHVGMFFKHGYNPGLVASALLNIPVSAYTVYYFATSYPLSLGTHVASFLVALAIQGTLMVWGLKFMKAKAEQSF